MMIGMTSQKQQNRTMKTFATFTFCLLVSSMRCKGFSQPYMSSRFLSRQALFAVRGDSSVKIKAEDDIWTSRRKIIRSTLKPMVKRQIERKKTAIEKATNNPEEKAVDDDDKKKKPTGLLVSAFFIAVSATVLRLGGRSAFVSMLGLDFVTGSGIRTQVNDFIEFFHSLGDTSQYAAFFLAWLAAKVFCIDAFTIVLALSSGVLFGGIFQGTAVSVICSSTASLFVFFLSRYVHQKFFCRYFVYIRIISFFFRDDNLIFIFDPRLLRKNFVTCLTVCKISLITNRVKVFKVSVS